MRFQLDKKQLRGKRPIILGVSPLSFSSITTVLYKNFTASVVLTGPEGTRWRCLFYSMACQIFCVKNCVLGKIEEEKGRRFFAGDVPKIRQRYPFSKDRLRHWLPLILWVKRKGAKKGLRC